MGAKVKTSQGTVLARLFCGETWGQRQAAWRDGAHADMRGLGTAGRVPSRELASV